MDDRLVWMMAALFVGAAFISDIRTMTITNRLNLVFFSLGIGYHVVTGGLDGGIGAVAGAAAGLAPLLALYMLKGIGAGDVKFFAALGALVGMDDVLHIFMYAVLYGGLMGLVMLCVSRSFGKRLLLGAASVWIADSRVQAWEASFANSGSMRFPFMIAVVPGAATAWYMMTF